LSYTVHRAECTTESELELEALVVLEAVVVLVVMEAMVETVVVDDCYRNTVQLYQEDSEGIQPPLSWTPCLAWPNRKRMTCHQLRCKSPPLPSSKHP